MEPNETFVEKLDYFVHLVERTFDVETAETILSFVHTAGDQIGPMVKDLAKNFAYERMKMMEPYFNSPDPDAFTEFARDSYQEFAKFDQLEQVWGDLVRLCGSGTAVTKMASQLSAAH